MPDGRRVLITGIAGTLATLLARSLEQRDDVARIVGIDVREPREELPRTRFVRADLRNPLVPRVITDEAIDTIVHASTTAEPGAAGGRASMKERNVIGAMQLLAACQKAPSVQRFVLKSSTAVYGSDHADPAQFREDATPAVPLKHGFGKDTTEIEGYVRAFGRRRKDVDVTILRFSNLMGAKADSAFLSLVTLPVVPSVLGFDPRLQFVHEEDAVAVLEQVATGSHPGIYNVAGDGVLYLSQCIRLAGRVPLPVPLPFVAAVAGAIKRSGRADVPSDQLRFLQFGRVVDTSRCREELDFEPRYTTREAFEDVVQKRRITGLLDRGEVVRWERAIEDFLDRRGQERFLASRPADGR